MIPHANTNLGQHYLVDQRVLAAILEVAAVRPGETIVEVGPGPGVLTDRLLEAGADLHAFELDERFVPALREKPLQLHVGDAVRLLPEVLPTLGQYAVVANLPYQVTTSLMRVFLEEGPRPSRIVVLIQYEVAARLAAQPGARERGYLSVLVQSFGEVRLVAKVPPTAFDPPPAVQSAVFTLTCTRSGLEPRLRRFVRAGFGSPRKQVKNVIAGFTGRSLEEVAGALAGVHARVDARASDLTEDQWRQLAERLSD